MSRAILICLAVIFTTTSVFARGNSSSSHSSGKTYVRPYTRSDGTHVSGHYRSARGSGTNDYNSSTYKYKTISGHSSTTASPRSNYQSYRKNKNLHFSDTPTNANYHTFTDNKGIVRDSNTGRIHRSQAAKRDFQKQNPCPSTGKTSGSCPGYIIDHVQALKRGGVDSPSNMQWQTIRAAKEKDKWE